MHHNMQNGKTVMSTRISQKVSELGLETGRRGETRRVGAAVLVKANSQERDPITLESNTQGGDPSTLESNRQKKGPQQ